MSAVSFGQTAEPSSLHHIEKRYNIFFPINSSKIERDFYSNSRTIETLRQDIENTFSNGRITPSASDSIYILSTSSPDGPRGFNRNLAKRRAESTSRFLQQLFPEFSQSNIIVEYIEENWDGLRQILRTDLDFPQREEMLGIIESSMSADDKERSLRGCTEGWEYFVNNHIYALRNSSITLTVLGISDEFATTRVLDRVENFSYTPVFEIPQSSIAFKASKIDSHRRQQVVAVRTNLLSPLTNIGVEVCLNDRWSLEADYYFPWVARNEDHQDAVQMLAWGVTGRCWLGKNRTYTSRLLGHSVGLGTYIGYYDLERNYTGHQGEFASVCLDYMYAMPVFNNRMHLEFTVGLGYLYSYARPYDVFESGGKAFREGYTKNIHWAGPLKAGVSLVVPIYMTRK
jgi:hypothetical protein